MSDPSATDVLVRGARAVARLERLPPVLDELLASVAVATGSGSGAVFVRDEATGSLTIEGSYELPPDAAAGLAGAVRNPAHAVARTSMTGEAAFDVLPMAPGGPALRSHLPLIVGRDGADGIVGVLALAHDQPIDAGLQPIVFAVADLLAVAIDRSRGR